MKTNIPLPPRPFWLAAIIEGGIGLAAVGLGILVNRRPADYFQWELAAALRAGGFTIPLVIVVWLAARCSWRPMKELMRLMDESATPLFRDCRVWELAIIAWFAGFGEEMLFRGVAQNAIGGLFAPPFGEVVGLVVASVVFGLLHAVTFTYAAMATLIGLYLGWLWIATGNLLVPSLVHALYDFWALVYLTRFRRAGNLS